VWRAAGIALSLDSMLSSRPRRGRAALVLLLAVLVAAPALGATHVHAPRHGEYVGQTHQKRELALYVAHRRARMTFEFDCTYLSGRATVRHLKLHRTRRGFTFAFHGRRAVTYADGRSPQRARLWITGRFARSGRRAHGRLRVKSARCGGSGKLAWSAAIAPRRVRQPSGRYDGKSAEQRPTTLIASGRSIDVASLVFSCGDATGTTNLDDVPLKLTRRGYAFDIRAHGGVTYSDDHPGENASVALSGRFAPGASKASGRFRVDSPRCGNTGWIAFRVKHAAGS
jgi:hypothetical protein